MNYQEDLKINRYCLEEEWTDHQEKYMQYAEAYSEAVRVRDDAKEELNFYKSKAQSEVDKVKAELDIEIRTKYYSFGYEKITEAIVASWIARQDKYQEVLAKYREIVREHMKKLNQAEYQVNVLDGVKRSFEHRKTAMDNLTRLMIGGYYSSKPAKDVGETVKKSHQERIESTMHEGLKESFKRRGRPRKDRYGEKS